MNSYMWRLHLTGSPAELFTLRLQQFFNFGALCLLWHLFPRQFFLVIAVPISPHFLDSLVCLSSLQGTGFPSVFFLSLTDSKELLIFQSIQLFAFCHYGRTTSKLLTNGNGNWKDRFHFYQVFHPLTFSKAYLHFSYLEF